MKAFTDFLTTDYGLMSAAVILGVLVMAGFFIKYFVGEMRKDEARLRQQQR